VAAIFAWIFLTLSAAVCSLVTWNGFDFAYRVTCAPMPAPVGFRLTFVFGGVVVYLAAAGRAVVLLRRAKRTDAPAALFLALLALVIPFAAAIVPVFVASMC
jgi:uncharacterized integral membrane protein